MVGSPKPCLYYVISPVPSSQLTRHLLHVGPDPQARNLRLNLCSNWNSHTLLVSVPATTLKAGSYLQIHTLPNDPEIPLPDINQEKKLRMCSKDKHKNIPRSTLYNKQTLEATEIFIINTINKLRYIHQMQDFSNATAWMNLTNTLSDTVQRVYVLRFHLCKLQKIGKSKPCC